MIKKRNYAQQFNTITKEIKYMTTNVHLVRLVIIITDYYSH